jgi:hypothetical protein
LDEQSTTKFNIPAAKRSFGQLKLAGCRLFVQFLMKTCDDFMVGVAVTKCFLALLLLSRLQIFVHSTDRAGVVLIFWF